MQIVSYMQTVSVEDNLHAMSKPIFGKNNKYFKMSSEIFTQHAWC